MPKMDVLVSSVTELLTAAVQEVLQLMGQAVLEYQQEHTRTRLENLKLQQKLKELQESMRLPVELPNVSVPKQGTSSLGAHSQEDVVNQINLAMSEEAKQPEWGHPLHENGILDDTTRNQHHSLQGSCENSVKNQSSLPRMKSSSKQRILNPFPHTRESPVTSSSETILDSSRMKLEPKTEPLEASPSGHRDHVTSQHHVVPILDDLFEHQGPSLTNIVLFAQDPETVSCTSQDVSRSQDEITGHAGVGVSFPGLANICKTLHSCQVCGQNCTSPSGLRTHLQCHSNERPFVCRYCKFRCSRITDLKKHERIHTGEKPYNCVLCGRRFNRKENLNRHLRMVHCRMPQLH